MGDTENSVRRAYYRENFDQLHTGHFSITSVLAAGSKSILGGLGWYYQRHRDEE